ncbi:MAG TPA: peptidoglycan DD-metalloendopeptidase family protein [Gammaproteobacteria bacterium]|nr:peptidoglycan DD-metalloendopeptidase family protein [Gammaproteobacteria bacterium]
MRPHSSRSLAIAAAMAAAVSLAACSGALNLPEQHRPQTYVVHRGDTLYSIAWHYGLDFHQVARWNGISPPYRIYPNQRIKLYSSAPAHSRSASHHTQKKKAVAANKTPRPAPKQTETVTAPAPQPAMPAGHAIAPGAGVAAAGGAPAGAAAPAAGPIHWQWPAGGTVEATFGRQDLSGKGIVITGDQGEPVLAAASGVVVYSGDALVGYGNLVIVKHNDEWLSAYGQNQQLFVHEGEAVATGQKIATMGLGPNGRAELYFEIRENGDPVDPLQFLPKTR